MTKLTKDKASEKAVKFLKENKLTSCIVCEDGQIFNTTDSGKNFAAGHCSANSLQSWEVKAPKQSKKK
jgi:hypothetical protein